MIIVVPWFLAENILLVLLQTTSRPLHHACILPSLYHMLLLILRLASHCLESLVIWGSVAPSLEFRSFAAPRLAVELTLIPPLAATSYLHVVCHVGIALDVDGHISWH